MQILKTSWINSFISNKYLLLYWIFQMLFSRCSEIYVYKFHFGSAYLFWWRIVCYIFAFLSRTIQDPGSQKLTWHKPPLTVLVIKKICDDSVIPPFIELVTWLLEVGTLWKCFLLFIARLNMKRSNTMLVYQTSINVFWNFEAEIFETGFKIVENFFGFWACPIGHVT